MELTDRGSLIDASRDYFYTGPDRKCFPVCFTCGMYSPFMIYLGNNEKSIKFRPEGKRTQLFCAVCSPDPDHFRKFFHGEEIFRADSILNDRKLLDLLKDHEYSNPHYELYSNVDRIIITENTQLCAAYKTVARRKAPKSFKLRWLMELFPATHRLPNKKYTSTEDLCESMKQKYHEICVSYMDMSVAGGSQLLDNFDILIDRTPMVQRQVSRKTVPFREPKSYYVSTSPVANLTVSSVADDVLNDSDDEIRAPSDSDDEHELASIISGGAGTNGSGGSSDSNEFQVSSGEVAGAWNIVPSSQSQSLPVSSQSTELHSSVNISSQSVAAEITVGEISSDADSTDSGRTIQFRKPRPARRQSTPADDDQQAGPSNVKRRRVSPRGQRPINPCPREAIGNPLGRLPRFGGG